MPDRTIVRHCSPTLAGLKTGNLFSAKYESRAELNQEIRKLNRLLTKKGLKALPVRYRKEQALIYVYRPDRLARDLTQADAKEILREKGYPSAGAAVCVAELVRRLSDGDEFPHEIGLFLGYPPQDVRGFMKSPRCNVKCVGCWKVYGNQEEAEKTFSRYKHCTEVYCREIENGRPLEKLIVPA